MISGVSVVVPIVLEFNAHEVLSKVVNVIVWLMIMDVPSLRSVEQPIVVRIAKSFRKTD